MDLKHKSDPARTVQLLRQDSRDGVRARWEAAARLLGLTALRELPDGSMLRRQPGDLDKSLRALARDGEREVPADSLRPVPDDIEWDRADPLQARVRPQPTFSRMIFYASFIPPAAAVIAVVAGAPLPLLLLLLLPVAAHFLRMQTRFQVGIVAGELHLSEQLGNLKPRTWTFPIDEVEQVWTASLSRRLVGQDMMAVTVESDRQTASLKPLSSAAGTWLYRFIHTVVADAPDAD